MVYAVWWVGQASIEESAELPFNRASCQNRDAGGAHMACVG